jgi:hypothetical protein
MVDVEEKGQGLGFLFTFILESNRRRGRFKLSAEWLNLIVGYE